VIGLDEVPAGYRAMNEREAIKVLSEPPTLMRRIRLQRATTARYG
jgi:hypothetical protein